MTYPLSSYLGRASKLALAAASITGFDHRDVRLLATFFKNMLRDRYLGSGLGTIWAVANPLLMLGMYTFVFGFIFQSRLPGASSSLAYVAWLIGGYGPWLSIVEGMSSATVAVTSNSALLKNLRFKADLLPIAGALMGIVPLSVSLAFLVVLLIIIGTSPGAIWLSVVPIFVLQFFFVTGIGLFLSALNVFVRDIALVLPNVLMLLLFGSPIFYPIEAFPRVLQPIALCNPIYIIAEGYRGPLVLGTAPPSWAVAYLAGLAIVVCAGGLAAFRRLRPHFDGRL